MRLSPCWKVYFSISQALLLLFHTGSPSPHTSFLSPSICQPSQERGALASKVIELLGGGVRQARAFCPSAVGFLPLGRGWGRPVGPGSPRQPCPAEPCPPPSLALPRPQCHLQRNGQISTRTQEKERHQGPCRPGTPEEEGKAGGPQNTYRVHKLPAATLSLNPPQMKELPRRA